MSRKKHRTWEQQIRIDQQNYYDECNTEQIKLKLNRKTDADVLDWLRKQQRSRSKSMQGEIKRLIREEIAREATESCRCTPTDNAGAQFNAVPENEQEEMNQYLSRPDVKSYLLRYPDVTEEEKYDLFQWLKHGYNYTENGHYLADESGCPMDFIQGERVMADILETAMAEEESY